MKKDFHGLFNDFYQEHYAMVRQLCLGYAQGNQLLASDLTQEVFINIWRALPRFRGEAQSKTWIYRIAVNTCLQYIRRESRRMKYREIATDMELKEVPTPAFSALYQAIGGLPRIDRLITMLTLEELPYREIADIFGLSESALRVRIHRIKKKLKILMEDGQRIS